MKKMKYICAALIFGLGLSSCASDYLDNSPTNALTDKQAVSSLSGLNTILQGVHGMMYTYSFSGDQLMTNGQAAVNYRLDMLGDDFINTLPAYWMGVYRWEEHTNPYKDTSFYMWDFYSTLNQHCNQILEAEDKIEVKEMDKSLYYKVMGEAHAFRAFSNFYLVQLYGKRYVKGEANDTPGVILRDKVSYDEKERSSVKETYDFILADMEKALDYLKKAPVTKEKNDLRYGVACGIASRIALAMQEWEKAKNYADEAIQWFEKLGAEFQVGMKLVDGFNNMDATEWVWGYRQTASQNMYYNYFFCDYSYNFEGHNDGLKFAVNRNLYKGLGEKDVRRKWFVCLDLGDKIPEDAYSQYFDMENGNPNWEVSGNCIKFKAKSKESSMGDVCYMRLAEFYYNKAEALSHLHQDAAALATLKEVMVTRDPEYNYEGTGDDLFNEIMRNKRLDFYGEGLRFLDMKRLKEMPDRLNVPNYDIVKQFRPDLYEKALKRNSGGNAKKLPTSLDDVVWQFAIPYNEIKGNKKCQQNPIR